MTQVIIVHGFKGKPDTNWKPWLKAQLEDKGVTVSVPEMPNTDTPIAEEWVAELSKVISQPDENTFLVGHSLGCITILRYLESLPKGVKVGGCVFVAGFTGRFDKYKGGHDSFFDHELNWGLIKSHTNKCIAIQSEDDDSVEIDQLGLFDQKLNAQTIRLKGKGHFGSADGIFEVPEVLDELLKLINNE